MSPFFSSDSLTLGRKHWQSACHTARPTLHMYGCCACRTACSAQHSSTPFSRESQPFSKHCWSRSTCQRQNENKKPFSVQPLPACLPPELHTHTHTKNHSVILCVNKTCLFVYFCPVELQNSAKYIPDLWEMKHKCSHFPPQPSLWTNFPFWATHSFPWGYVAP